MTTTSASAQLTTFRSRNWSTVAMTTGRAQSLAICLSFELNKSGYMDEKKDEESSANVAESCVNVNSDFANGLAAHANDAKDRW